MPAAAWMFVGAAAGLVGIGLSFRIVVAVSAVAVDASTPVRHAVPLRAAAAALGAATAWRLAQSASAAGATMLVVVSALLVLQAPVDLFTRRLSRPVTLAALLASLAVVTLHALESDSYRPTVVVLASSGLVVGAYAVVHRLSPRSLGRGDVLLCAPLALALAFLRPEHLASWQLLAATSAAVHAVAARASIPFGPHLLVAAWAVAAAGV